MGEILNLIESVSEVFPSYFYYYFPVPLFPGTSMFMGTKLQLQEFPTASLRQDLNGFILKVHLTNKAITRRLSFSIKR